ncbi:ArsR/SmtB family transcription factor [Actinophytocola sp.]|uniref:ArsR/SmtB family transcription factor n=1 Tax=Actinophytocola sp. TaxID=1872138 RepID=UPI003D6C4196
MAEALPRITDPKALRALAHPLRWQLLEIVGREGTATATQCAQETGESVANCSYHLNTLAKYGYVEKAEGGQGREKPWRVVREDFQLRVDELEGDTANAAWAASGAFLDYVLNQIKERHLTAHLLPQEWQVVGVDNSKVFMTPEEVEELRSAVRDLTAKFRERRADPALRPDGARSVGVFVATTVADATD